MYNILLVEDNKEIQELNKNLLESEGYNTSLAMNLAGAWQSINESAPDMIILDIMLPDGSGLDFLRELREGGNDTPILLLTALGTTEEKVAGLKTGGDDYLAKPYDNAELLARVESLTRRIRRDTLTYGDITINKLSQRAFINGEDLNLQAKEYSLLLVLVRNENKTVGTEYLYEKVWGLTMNHDKQAVQRTLSRLRSKIASSGYFITAERGEGYRFWKS